MFQQIKHNLIKILISWKKEIMQSSKSMMYEILNYFENEFFHETGYFPWIWEELDELIRKWLQESWNLAKAKTQNSS